MSNNPIKISIKNLYKIFGNDPQSALAHVKEGMGKTELLDKTGHVLGLQAVSYTHLTLPTKA